MTPLAVDSSMVSYLLGPAGAAGLALLLVLTGFLIPKPYHKRVLDENERLKQANDALIEANSLLRDTNRDLAAGNQLTNQVVSELLSLARRSQDPAPPASGKSP